MSEQGTESRSAAVARDLLSPIQFQQEVRRVIRFRSQAPCENPLAEAVRRIEQNPAYSQSRLLARILTALTYQQGEFRRAEIAALDAETLAMVITLMDAHAGGKSTPEEWMLAADTAKATQVGAGA